MAFTENRSGTLVYMTSPKISASHGFTTRLGGVSGGIYSALNLGQNVGDVPENVQRNYNLLGAALGFDPERLALTRQVHGNCVRHVSKKDLLPPFAPVPEADGLITNETDVPLMIFTADCVPILLFDPVGCAAGAVHAGWRGTVADIAGTAVREMARLFGSRPADIRAAVGPCISACCFETKEDVKNAVIGVLGNEASQFITPRGDTFMIDLKGINRSLLQGAGVTPENIDIAEDCTACRSDMYWSHRVTKGQRGSQAAVIMMKGCMH